MRFHITSEFIKSTYKRPHLPFDFVKPFEAIFIPQELCPPSAGANKVRSEFKWIIELIRGRDFKFKPFKNFDASLIAVFEYRIHSFNLVLQLTGGVNPPAARYSPPT